MVLKSEIIKAIEKAVEEENRKDRWSIAKTASLLRAENCENPLDVTDWLPMGSTPITYGTVIVDSTGRVCAPDITAKIHGADIGRLTTEISTTALTLFEWSDAKLKKLPPKVRAVMEKLRKKATKYWIDSSKSSSTKFSHIGQKVDDFINGV